MDVHKCIGIYHVYIRRLDCGKSLPHVHMSFLSNINAVVQGGYRTEIDVLNFMIGTNRIFLKVTQTFQSL